MGLQGDFATSIYEYVIFQGSEDTARGEIDTERHWGKTLDEVVRAAWTAP
jgi:hypothetical protein